MASKTSNNALEGFRFFNDPVTPEKIKDIARKELGETEELKERCLQQIRALINEHKVTCITRDDFLLRFLRTRKFDVHRAFESLRGYAHQRAAIHKRLMRFRPEALAACLRHNILGFLPYRDAEERLVFHCTIGSWNASISTDEEVAMTIIVLVNYAAESESSQVSGTLALFENTSLPLYVAPFVLKHAYFVRNFLFNGLPMRYKGFHSINESSVSYYFLRIIEPFMSRKLRRRIFLHGKTRDAYFQVFPRCILPDEFGGTLGPQNSDHLIDVMLDYLQKMKDEQKYFIQQNQ